MVGDLQELFTEFLHSIRKVVNNPRDKMKFTVANKNDILTMKIKWHWSEIILDCPKKNIYSFLQCYIFLFFKKMLGKEKGKKREENFSNKQTHTFKILILYLRFDFRI